MTSVRLCRACGCTFTKHPNAPIQRYCTRRCKGRAKMWRRWGTRAKATA